MLDNEVIMYLIFMEVEKLSFSFTNLITPK